MKSTLLSVLRICYKFIVKFVEILFHFGFDLCPRRRDIGRFLVHQRTDQTEILHTGVRADITGEDYQTPQLRQVRNTDNGDIVDVFVPLVPARAKDRQGYTDEFESVGFNVEKFIEMDVFDNAPHSASIYVRK